MAILLKRKNFRSKDISIKRRINVKKRIREELDIHFIHILIFHNNNKKKVWFPSEILSTMLGFWNDGEKAIPNGEWAALGQVQQVSELNAHS